MDAIIFGLIVISIFLLVLIISTHITIIKNNKDNNWKWIDDFVKFKMFLYGFGFGILISLLLTITAKLFL